jgi:hypothetical protein
MTTFGDLPDDIVDLILGFVPVQSVAQLVRFSRVNKRFESAFCGSAERWITIASQVLASGSFQIHQY